MNPVQVKKGRSETLYKRKDTGKLEGNPKTKTRERKNPWSNPLSDPKHRETNLKNAKEIKKRKGKRQEKKKKVCFAVTSSTP